MCRRSRLFRIGAVVIAALAIHAVLFLAMSRKAPAIPAPRPEPPAIGISEVSFDSEFVPAPMEWTESLVSPPQDPEEVAGAATLPNAVTEPYLPPETSEPATGMPQTSDVTDPDAPLPRIIYRIGAPASRLAAAQRERFGLVVLVYVSDRCRGAVDLSTGELDPAVGWADLVGSHWPERKPVPTNDETGAETPYADVVRRLQEEFGGMPVSLRCTVVYSVGEEIQAQVAGLSSHWSALERISRPVYVGLNVDGTITCSVR